MIEASGISEKILDMVADGYSKKVICSYLRITTKNYDSRMCKVKKANGISSVRRLKYLWRLQRAGVLNMEDERKEVMASGQN